MSEAEDLRRYRYLLLDSPKAEEFFCKEIFDLILEPYQVLMMKLIRGRLRTEEQLYSFLDAYDLNFIDRSGFIGFTPGSYIRFVPNSPFSEIMAPGGMGKALALDTPLVTPTGWTTMEKVQVGDELFDEQGKVCRVTYKSPIWLNRECYEVRSNSCTPLVADADHLWSVTVDNRSKPHLHDTRFLAKSRCKSSPSVPPTKPLDLPEADLPVAPYTLGVWLGDGHTDGARVSQGAQDKQFIREQVEADGYVTTDHRAAINFGILKLQSKLRDLGVLGNKHIPVAYLRSSTDQRLSLLQGLIDTDGYVDPNHNIEFCSTKWKLAYDVLELVRTLGVKASLYHGRATLNGVDCGPKYRVYFKMENAARLPRKLGRCKAPGRHRTDHALRATPCNSVPVACIQVDSPSHLYLAGDAMIPTHNTTCLNMAATMEACDNPNSRNQLIFKNAEEGYSCSSVVRQYLELPQLVELFGRFVPADKAVPWSNKRFSLDQREAPDLRANFEFYGVNSDDALGKRSDRVIIDDAETTDTARTPEACAKLIEWVNTGPMTSPMAKWPKGADGRVVVPKAIRWSKTAQYWGLVNLGTIFHPKGLHAKFMNDPRFTVLRLDCFKDKSCKVSLNPKMQTVEDLEKMRRGIGTLVFNKRMRNIAYDPAEMAFQEVWIKGGEDYIDGRKLTFPGCLDYDRGYGEYEKDWELYLGFDPATGSTSRWSAYSAYVVLGVDPKADDRTLHIVDLLKLQCEHSRMLDHLLTGNPEYGIEGFLNKYPIKNAVVEKNNHGSMLLGDDRTKPWCDSGVIIPSYTTAQNKLDPEIGVFSMAALVENGKLRIPYRDPSDQEKAFVLIDDLVQFPKVKSDLVMALWLAQLPARKRNPYKSWFARGGHGKFYKNPAYR